jgi:hypothetical protein
MGLAGRAGSEMPEADGLVHPLGEQQIDVLEQKCRPLLRGDGSRLRDS